MNRRATLPLLAASLLCCAWLLSGCFGPPVSQSYFGLDPGNSWLYEGASGSETGSMSVEVKVIEPGPGLKLNPDVYDLSVTGSLGNFQVSEEGLLLEILPDSIKLWGTIQSAGTTQLYNQPYVWLEKPLAVGKEYNTAIRGTPTPARMVVTGQMKEQTPWGEKDAFTLQEKTGSGPAAGITLTFVPYLGFTRISVPDWPELKLKDASLK